MPDADNSWRPNSAWACDLSDRDLAGVGLLTQFDVQIYSSLSLALKALEGLDLNQWRNLDQTPLEQISRRVRDAATGVDQQLSEQANAFHEKQKPILKKRHKIVHSLWGYDPGSQSAKAIYRKTHERLDTSDIDDALTSMSELTVEAKEIVMRCGELIVQGALPAGNSRKAPQMLVDGGSAQF